MTTATTRVQASRTARSVGTGNEANRTAWIEAALKKIPVGGRILDAGAGEQQYKRCCGHLTYVSQDFAQYDGKGDASGLQLGSWDNSGLDIVSDITAIPEPDASFDAIMCTEVFEHLPNPIKAIEEFARLMRPGGHLVITAPFCSMTHFAPYHFGTGFSRYFYEYHLPANSFEIAEMTPSGNYFEYVAQEVRRAPHIGGRYTKSSASRFEYYALRVVLKMLARFSTGDSGSSELLHYGYHVRAFKK